MSEFLKDVIYFSIFVLIRIKRLAVFLLRLLIVLLNKFRKIAKRKYRKIKMTTKKEKYLIIDRLSILAVFARNFLFNLKKLKGVLSDKKIFFRNRKRSYNVKRKKIFAATFFYKLKFFIFGILFSFFVIFLPLLFVIFASQLPNPYSMSINSIPKTTKIYDRNGNLLYEVYANQNRTIVKLSDVPSYLKNATIAIEDKDFYEHPGFDIRGIIRAAYNNFKNKELQGGSTITQQLIKSAFFSPQPTVTRKVKEIILAFVAEQVFTKEKILELYFNYVPYGGTAWGAQAASEIYFGKDVSELDLAESAFLAGMPKAPSIYSPYNGEKLWKNRQKEVLDAMEKSGYISKKEAEDAYKKELLFNNPSVPIKAPHFVMYIRDYLIKKYGFNEVERGGLKVITTLDLDVQEMAEKIVLEEVENNKYLNINNGAALITDPKNGDILAMVGNHNYFDMENGGNVNVTTSLRQPGSAIKIVTYSLALSSGFTEATILDDSPLVIQSVEGPYIPVNYDGKFRGRIPLRLAFANSLNIPAVRVAQRVGVDNIISFGKKMGIKSWSNSNKYGLSITLGAVETTMFDIARIYGTIANEGKLSDTDPVLEITDSEGNVVYKKNSFEKQIVDSGIAFVISDILADNRARSIEFGLNSPLNIEGHRVSVKTGTSDYKKDNWTAGFTKDYVVVTWVGNNNNSPMSQYLASGITGAAPMWNKIMTSLLKDKQDDLLIIPDNVVQKYCYGYNAYFVKGTEKSANCGSYMYFGPTPTSTAMPVSVSAQNSIQDYIQRIKRRN